MAILEDEYMKYDFEGHYYYLTEAAIGNFVINGEDVVTDWNRPERRLKTQGRLLHMQYINSGYNGERERYRHRDFIEYRVFKNEYGERQAIFDSLINFVEVADLNDIDLDVLSGEKSFPKSVLMPLFDAGVWFRGKICSSPIPEDEYRVGY